MRLINLYGRKSLNTGSLVNKAPGGHNWKDSIKVYQYDLDGNFIAEWKDPKTVESILNISHGSIYKSCRLFYKAGGYQFRTFKVQKIDPYINKQKKPIYKFSKLGVFIKAYESVIEAAKEINVTPERLGQAAKKNKSCKGFLWAFISDYCIVKRIISQYDFSTITLETPLPKLVAQYTSLPEAAKALKVNSINSIDNAIKGKVQHSAYGYLWNSENYVKVYNDKNKTKNM
jgi:hypothetical protein